MPNWNLNDITISHTDPQKRKLLLDAIKSDNFMSVFYPTPYELTDEGIESSPLDRDTRELLNLKEFKYRSWYDWRIANWGVKWDFSLEDAEISEEENLTTINGVCETTWGPPLAFFEKLVEDGYSVRVLYYEPGAGFCGIWENEDDLYCQIDPEDLSDIPNELLERFSIEECFDSIEDEDDDD